MVRPSRWARRFTAARPFAVGGPAAGHALMKHRRRPHGPHGAGHAEQLRQRHDALGHLPVGRGELHPSTSRAPTPDAHQRRWGLRKGDSYRWHEHDERFDAGRHPNEPNRFGWVVEIDPHDPASTPVKRTALGRAAHEGAWVATTRDGRAVVYRARTRASNTSTSSSAATASAPAAPDESQRRRCWTTARCTWRASTPTAPAAGCRWCMARAR
jgi:secreted PhoX family phosphatase